MNLRERKRLKLKQLIVDSARTLFSERGYGAVHIEEIAASCEVSKPTLYKYFPGKQSIAVEIAAELHREIVRQIEVTVDVSGTPLQQGLGIVAAWSSVLERHQLLYQSLFVSNAFSSIGSEDQIAYEDELIALFGQLSEQRLALGKTAGGHSRDDLSYLMATMIFGTSAFWARDPEKVNLERILQKHMRLLLQ